MGVSRGSVSASRPGFQAFTFDPPPLRTKDLQPASCHFQPYLKPVNPHSSHGIDLEGNRGLVGLTCGLYGLKVYLPRPPSPLNDTPPGSEVWFQCPRSSPHCASSVWRYPRELGWHNMRESKNAPNINPYKPQVSGTSAMISLNPIGSLAGRLF